MTDAPKTKSCIKCKHFYIDGEGWELPQYDYAECRKHKNRSHLTSFPFKNTKCKSWEIEND